MLIYIIREIHIPNEEVDIWDVVSYHLKNDSQKISEDFKRFHDILTTKFPCPSKDKNSVWGGVPPLINNFGEKIARIDLKAGPNDEKKAFDDAFSFLLRLANEFGFHVCLEGATKIISPDKPPTRALHKMTINTVFIVVLFFSLDFISQYVIDFQSGTPVEVSGGGKKAKFVKFIFLVIAKWLSEILDFQTFRFLVIGIAVISIIWLAYGWYNYFNFKRRWNATRKLRN